MLSWGDVAQLSLLKREDRGAVPVAAPVGVYGRTLEADLMGIASGALAFADCGTSDCRKDAISSARKLVSTA